MTSAVNATTTETSLLESLETWAREGVLDRIEQILQRRREYWEHRPHERPSPREVRGMVRQAALKNATLSGSATLLPGPLGFVSIPPELLLSLTTTVELVYDIALAYQKEEQVEIATVLALAASDARAIGLLVQQRDGDLVRRPGRRVLDKIVRLASRQLFKRIARLFVGRLVPFLGAAGAFWWARTATTGIGRRAVHLFRDGHGVVPATEDESAAIEREVDARSAPLELPESPELLTARYHLFVDLLRHSKTPSLAQIEKIEAMANDFRQAGCVLEDATVLLEQSEAPLVNLSLFAGDDASEVFGDAAAFGGLGSGVPARWAYELGKSFGMDPDDVDDILADPPPSRMVA